MPIYIDLDGTVFDYLSQYIKYHEDFTGQKFQKSDFKKYNIHEIMSISDEDKYNYLREDGFFENMGIYAGAKEIIDQLHEKYDVYFVSTIVVPEAYIGKVKALEKHFDWFDHSKHLKTMSDKYMLKSGILFDDAPHVLEDSYDQHITIKANQLYNMNVKSHYVISSWNQEVLHLINKII